MSSSAERWRLRRPSTYVTAFALAAVVRVAWGLYLGRHHPDLAQFPDSRSYLDPAHSLLDRGRFDAAATQPGRAMLFRTPGYPTFLALVQLVFGRSLAPILVAQGLVGGLVAPIVVDLSRRLGATARAAGWAGYVAALEPLSIVASGFVLTETLAQVATVGAVWLLVRLVQQQSWRLGIAAGAALATSLMIRPAVYYLVPVLILVVAWALRAAERRRLLVLAFALPLVLTVGGWHVRNHVVAGFDSFSSVEHVDLALWRGVGVERRLRHQEGEVRPLQVEAALEAARRAGSRSADPELLLLGQAPPDVDQAAYYEQARSLGLAQLRGHPDLALRDMLNGATAVAVDVDETRLGLSPFTTSPAVEVLLQSGLVVLYALSVLGFATLLRRHRRELVILGLTVTYVLGTASGPEAVGRHRLPVLPLLVPLAVAGVLQLREWDRRRVRRPAEGGGSPIGSPAAPA